MKIRANNIDIEIEDTHSGDMTGLPVVLLIMGLGMQLVTWPPALVQALVLHGKADPLVPFACGEDTARRIPGAKLVGIDGMGHDLQPGVVERVLAPLIRHLDTVRVTT